jgi:type VI secretion system secreted protein Hcp
MAHGFIKIDGIPGGGSTDNKYKDWIEATSFSHGMSKATDIGSLAPGRGQAGGVHMGDFTFSKVVGKDSPKIRQDCCAGRYIKKVEVELCETTAGEHHPYETFILEKVLISSVHYGGPVDDMSGRAQETITLTFGQITWAYTPVDDDHKPGPTVRAGWDCINNKPI